MTRIFLIRSVVSLALGVSMAWTVVAAFGQNATMRWKFASGDHFEITIEQTTSLQTEADLVTQTIETSNAILFDWKVTEINPQGIASIDMTIRSMKIKVNLPFDRTAARMLEVDTAVAVDPKSPPNVLADEARKNLQAIVGKSFRLKVTERGEITSVELDAATKDAIRQAPQSMQIRQLLTEDGIRDLLASGSPMFPEKAIEPQNSWSIGKEFVLAAGKFRREQVFTWSGTETHEGVPQEKFDVATKLSFLGTTPSGEASDSDAAKLSIKSQSSSGTIWFDAQRGMITSASVSSTLETQAPYRDKNIVTKLGSRVELSVRRVE